ncbi:MAG: LysR family transcriptional regulator [Nitrospira sp.]|nr:LysR family transcriptional regulator [Nitrospira sp.]
MARPDLNLLVTLDVLLSEGSVARAGQRLRLSPSAMSRALARLRATTGDPLLVRAGRGLVPTPRALELRERVSHLVQDVQAVLRPAEQLKLNQLVQTFTLRTSEGFVENFGAPLIATVPERHTGVLRAGMYSFGLPVSTPEFTASMLWHPRLDADLAHRWLRGCVREVCTQRLARLGRSGKKKGLGESPSP